MSKIQELKMAKKLELETYVSMIAEHAGDATLIRKTAEFLPDAKSQEPADRRSV
jgi:hypothetical protein